MKEHLDLVVIARIIEALYIEGAMKKTQLQMASRLNYKTFTRYLNWLTEKKLIETDSENGYVKLTRNGLETYQTLVAWTRRYLERL
ncbi:MAG: winged helix-turn-helix domain-containing protein [Candidatus Methanomethylicia archaeon]